MTNFWRKSAPRVSDLRRCMVLAALLLASSCQRGPDYLRLSGSTMGTYYSVVTHCPAGLDAARLQPLLEEELTAVNAQMSTYDPASELSVFNLAPPGTWHPVSAELVALVEAAAQLSERSGGAFDVTVAPLVNAWGFGPGSVESVPTPERLAQLRMLVDYRAVEFREEPPALRKRAAVTVDLSAIAKGHGVDRLAELLLQQGCSDFLVDIGGEVRVQGNNPRGALWAIGVEVPDPNSQGGVARVLRLSSQSVATSGDYRNFRTVAGRRVSHTIDPRTGRPVEHHLASVTVVHESAAWADGLATAISVLGPDAGARFAETMELAALMIVRRADSPASDPASGLVNADGAEHSDNREANYEADYEERYTEPMKQYLVAP